MHTEPQHNAPIDLITHQDDNKHVLFRLGDGLFGIPVRQVCELLVLTRATPLPNTPHYVRGVINLRGQVVPVLDLRLRLNMKSLGDENAELQKQLSLYEQQHVAWLAELEASVREGRPFKQETNPHKCAFGRWYDSFASQSVVLQNHMLRFNEPHQALHAIAAVVAQLTNRGATHEALALIEQTRDGALKPMLSLFTEARSLILEECREIAVVLKHDDNLIACSVDQVVAVDDVSDHDGPDSDTLLNVGIKEMAFYGPSQEVVSILDPYALWIRG